jgi:hypothetical protein
VSPYQPAGLEFGIARQVECLGLVICLNTIPVGSPTALLLACLVPHKKIRATLLTSTGQAGSSGRRYGNVGEEAADGTAIAENDFPISSG